MKRSFVIAALLLGACSTVLLLPPQVDAGEPPVGVWYYCDSTMSYYPRVLVCKEGWRVVPAIPSTAPPPFTERASNL
jgi:hypothetical protein